MKFYLLVIVAVAYLAYVSSGKEFSSTVYFFQYHLPKKITKTNALYNIELPKIFDNSFCTI